MSGSRRPATALGSAHRMVGGGFSSLAPTPTPLPEYKGAQWAADRRQEPQEASFKS